MSDLEPRITRRPLHHAFVVVITSLRLGALNIMAYRGEFFLAVVNVVIGLVSQVFGLWVIFGNTSSLNGWSADQILVLIGVHTLLRGFLDLIVRPSMDDLMEAIRLGTFDFTLTKPADSQLLAASKVFAPSAITNLLAGILVVVVGMVRLDDSVGASELLSFAVTLLCGLVMFASILVLLTTMSFWFVKLTNVLVIFESIFGQAGKWPIAIFPQWLQFGLTFLVPVGFAVTVPAQAVGQGVAWTQVGLAVILAGAFAVVARLFWRVGIRHYTGASA